MSDEQLKAFLEKVKADTSLQERLKMEGADPAAIAKNAGFRTSADELKGEISEEELNESNNWNDILRKYYYIACQ